MMKFSRKIFLSGLFLSVMLFEGSAQELNTFTPRYQGFVHGDMTVIANNILNRADKKTSPTLDYSPFIDEAKTNDAFEMEYINIDRQKNIFSSSSAALFMKDESDKKIVYAGLYWSATYKYERGYERREGKFLPEDSDRFPFDKVMLKLPRQNYKEIKGEILYDGFENKKIKDASPYAVYADITALVTALDNPFGIYTVANIRATQGTLKGGSAAGWTIVFVYEDPNDSGKYITTYDGFANVDNDSFDIHFKGFEPVNNNQIQAKIAAAALEGDFNIKGDMLYFGTPESDNMSNLKTGIRNASNFFNSSITIEEKHFESRIPASKNTLGYDTFLMSIPNFNNRLITNTTTEATLRLKSNGDQFYFFFTAFALDTGIYLELEEAVVEAELEEEVSAKVDETTQEVEEEVTQVAPIEEAIPPTPEKITEAPTAVETAVVETIQDATALVTEEEKTPEVIEKVEIKSANYINIKTNDQDPGYYLIANVFSDRNNATRFMIALSQNDLKPNYFIRADNDYYYVYLAFDVDKSKIESLYKSKINNTYLEELWILLVEPE